MPNKQRQLLGQILIGKKLITPQQLLEAFNEQKKTKEFLGIVLLKRGWIKEKDLLEALSEQFNIPLMGLKDKYIDWEFVKQFKSSLILDYRCFPIKRNDRSITFAITNPLDVRIIQKAEEEAKGLKVKLALVSEEDINDVIRRYRQYMRANITKLF